ncbi:GNAT family N-acetyltransferase [Thalassomonas sp. M1454]|uniref:GNAT family N-acetyltransferase n=1 Tax=Thalassomonas sp. M1454 TaxID=2594477 RepID=UPI00117E8AA2|nr:GNAT family N-acetyltransferase [Thalassomonas sp. M1454]TRX56708.1 GNAT family N-acetyltransferase [Thalassomonas sp. M1454]
MGRISEPLSLNSSFDLTEFDCGEESLNYFLKKKSMKNQISGASKTYVCTVDGKVVAYYSLAFGCVERKLPPGNIKRNMPENIPVIILGRLAVDKQFAQSGLGSQLLRNAILRSLNVSRTIGVKAILVHALSQQAKSFYSQYGFITAPFNENMLLYSLDNLKKSLK